MKLTSLEVSLVKRSESGYCTLLSSESDEANAKRHAFSMLSKRNLDINNFAMFPKQLLKFFFGHLIR